MQRLQLRPPRRFEVRQAGERRAELGLEEAEARGRPQRRAEPAEDELIVTSGGMECIDLLCRTMLEPGDGVAVEAPTYLGAILGFAGYGARQQVRKNALQHLHQEITITRKSGSFTLEESLTELVKQGLVDRKDAMTRAVHPDELERLLG